jgi:hypothetical protein
LRIDVLKKFGGVYLDLDVWALKSFDVFCECETVLGMQGNEYGLRNAVIVAMPESRFLNYWLQSYKDYDGSSWDEHSVRRPLLLARDLPSMIHIQPETAFFWPSYKNPESIFYDDDKLYRATQASLIKKGNASPLCKIRQYASVYSGMQTKSLTRARSGYQNHLDSSYSVHLWEKLWGETYLSRINPQWLEHSKCLLATKLRSVLGHTMITDIANYA